MGLKHLMCCCVGEWFDYYGQPTDLYGDDDTVERIGACTPPSKSQVTYGSSDADPTYSGTNSAGNYSLYVSMSAKKSGGGDYDWRLSDEHDLQLFSWDENGMTQEYTVTPPHTAFVGANLYRQGPYRVPDDYQKLVLRGLYYFGFNTRKFGNFDPMNADGISKQQTIYHVDPSGDIFYVGLDGTDRKYVVIDDGGTADVETHTEASLNSDAARADSDAKLLLVAPRVESWGLGLVLEASMPDSSTIQYDWTFYTGTRKDGPRHEVNETNFIATFSDSSAGDATDFGNLYSETDGQETYLPEHNWTGFFYERSSAGEEIVCLLKWEHVWVPSGFGGNYFLNFLQLRWYANGTLFLTYDYPAFAGTAIRGAGPIISAIAVDPDASLGTSTRFVVSIWNDSENYYELQGLDEDGATVWTITQLDGDEGTPYIRAANDRYVYVRGLVLSPDTETGGRVTIAAADVNDWMVRLDGDLNWPHVAHDGSSQIERQLTGQTVETFDCEYIDVVKDTTLPYSPEIDLAGQWDGNYT